MERALVFAGAFVYAALYAPQPLLPAIERRLHAPLGAAGLGMAAPMLGLVLGPWLLLALGARRRLLPLGVLGVGATSLLAATLPGLWGWTLLRFLTGVFLSAVVVFGFALLPPRRVAAFVALNALGGALGRSAAGVLADLVGLRAALGLLGGLPLLLAPFFLRSGPHPPLAPPARPRLARAMATGAAVLFANLFLANLLPYRLERAGFGPAAIGGFYLAYLGGLLGPFLAARWGLWAGRALATIGALLLLTPWAFPGFALFIAGIFGLHAVLGGGFGRRGEGVAYVSGYYLGGMAAGLVYPLFLGLPFAFGVGFALTLLLLVSGYNPAKCNAL